MDVSKSVDDGDINEAPKLMVTSPSNNKTVTAESISFFGFASDDNALSKITWISSDGGSGVADGLENWSISNIPLTMGNNTIIVTAHDDEGDTSSVAIVVTRIEVPTTDIPDGSITSEKIADASISSRHIMAAGITGMNIAGATLTRSHIVNGTLTGADIANGTIRGSNIASGTIRGSNIASGTIRGSNIAVGAIQKQHISVDGICTSHIENAAITESKLSIEVQNKFTKLFEEIEALKANGDETMEDDIALEGDVKSGEPVLAVNFNGPAANYYRQYLSHSQAVANGMVCTAKNTVERDFSSYSFYGSGANYTNSDLLSILNTAVWNSGSFSVRYPVPNGQYALYFLVAENYEDYCRSLKIAINAQYTTTIPKLKKSEFFLRKVFAWVTDGNLDISVIPLGHPEAHLMGMYVYKV